MSDSRYDPEAGPLHYPICSECESPYLLRKTIVPGDWLWFRDCKHKTAAFRTVDAPPPPGGQQRGAD